MLDRQQTQKFRCSWETERVKKSPKFGLFFYFSIWPKESSQRILTKKIFKLSSNESIGTHQNNIMKRCIKILTLSCGLPKCMCFFNLKFETWWFSFELKIITEDAVFSLVNWMLIVSLWAVKIMSTLAKNARTLTRASWDAGKKRGQITAIFWLAPFPTNTEIFVFVVCPTLKITSSFFSAIFNTSSERDKEDPDDLRSKLKNLRKNSLFPEMRWSRLTLGSIIITQ